MKHVFSLILSLILIFVFSGCRDNKSTDSAPHTEAVEYKADLDCEDRSLRVSINNNGESFEFSNRYGGKSKEIYSLINTESFVFLQTQAKPDEKCIGLSFCGGCTQEQDYKEFTVYGNDIVGYLSGGKTVYYKANAGTYTALSERLKALADENAKYFTLDENGGKYKYSFLKGDGGVLTEESENKPYMYVVSQNVSAVIIRSGSGSLAQTTVYYDKAKNIKSASYSGITDFADGFVCASTSNGFVLYYMYNSDFSKAFTEFEKPVSNAAEPVAELYFSDADTVTVKYYTDGEIMHTVNIPISEYKEAAKTVKPEVSVKKPVKKPAVSSNPSVPAKPPVGTAQTKYDIPDLSNDIKSRLSEYSSKRVGHSWLYPEPPEKLNPFNAYACGDTGKNTVYLTFDNGYEYKNLTTRILDILAEKQVKAVFFITMPYAKSNPAVVRRMINEGHAVGNHTVNHPDMSKIDINKAYKEVKELHDYMEKSFNYSMHLFRFPEGAHSDRTLALLKEIGYKSVFWNFAYRDWDTSNQPSPASAKESVMKYTKNGTIYLLHSCSATNVKILPDIIDSIRAAGYTNDLFD